MKLQALFTSKNKKSSGSVVDNMLDCQSRDRKIDAPLLRSLG